jgi:transposase
MCASGVGPQSCYLVIVRDRNWDRPGQTWREWRRIRAWDLHQAGWLNVQIAHALGATEAAVSQWIKAARDGGIESLRAPSRQGQASRLSAEQVQYLMTLLERGATSFGFAGDLWTCARIALVIEQELSVHYHPDHVSRLLHQQDWTYQKPILQASQRNEEEIADWLARGWPALKEQAEKEARTIVFIDESGFYLSPTITKTWAPVGETPVLRAPAGHEHLSVIGGLTLEGSLYMQIHESSIKAHEAVLFLRHLLMHIPERLLVLWDRSKIHKSREFDEFRRMDSIGRMTIERFPAYAPEVDPQEYVWHQLKHVDLRNLSSFSLDQLWIRLQDATRRLRQRAGVLRKFIGYAGLHT